MAVPDGREQNGGMSRFIVVPQWQGSSSTRAMALIDGADAIAGDLPRSGCSHVDVPLEAGDEIGTGVHRASSLLRTRRETIERIESAADTPIVIGGDAGVSVWAADALSRDGDLAVAWFGAHPALHTPATSPTGAFEGMALSAVLGEFPGDLAVPHGRVSSGGVVLVGARDYDDPEYLSATGVATLGAEELGARPAAAADALAPGAPKRLFVHVALDALDPAEFSGVAFPSPFGISPEALTDAIGVLRSRFDLVGAAITGFAPPSPAAAVDDMGTILRIVSALTKPAS